MYLSLLDTNQALIRTRDFPRIQIAATLGLALVATPFALSRPAALLFGAALTPSLAWQLYWIHPCRLELYPSSYVWRKLLSAVAFWRNRRVWSARPAIETRCSHLGRFPWPQPPPNRCIQSLINQLLGAGTWHACCEATTGSTASARQPPANRR